MRAENNRDGHSGDTHSGQAGFPGDVDDRDFWTGER